MDISHSLGSGKINSIWDEGRQRLSMEGLQKKMTTGRCKTKAEGAAITFKKGIKVEGQRRKRAIEVRGKIW